MVDSTSPSTEINTSCGQHSKATRRAPLQIMTFYAVFYSIVVVFFILSISPVLARQSVAVEDLFPVAQSGCNQLADDIKLGVWNEVIRPPIETELQILQRNGKLTEIGEEAILEMGQRMGKFLDILSKIATVDKYLYNDFSDLTDIALATQVLKDIQKFLPRSEDASTLYLDMMNKHLEVIASRIGGKLKVTPLEISIAATDLFVSAIVKSMQTSVDLYGDYAFEIEAAENLGVMTVVDAYLNNCGSQTRMWQQLGISRDFQQCADLFRHRHFSSLECAATLYAKAHEHTIFDIKLDRITQQLESIFVKLNAVYDIRYKQSREYITGTALPQTLRTFEDVQETDWFSLPIARCRALGPEFCVGYNQSTFFKPARSMLTVEFIHLATRFAGKLDIEFDPVANPHPAPLAAFTEQWFYNDLVLAYHFINPANGESLLAGLDLELLGQPVTRGEAARIIYNLLRMNVTAVHEQRYQDIRFNHSLINITEGVSRAGIFNGYPNHHFLPDNPMPRAEGVKALVAAFLE